jgi:hypothetical protein
MLGLTKSFIVEGIHVINSIMIYYCTVYSVLTCFWADEYKELTNLKKNASLSKFMCHEWLAQL